MAPRGRPRKVGQSRMDAAIDALTPMGYSRSLIQSRVNALLKVYDGEWRFIEESSYQVLLDNILEEQEQECKNKALVAMEDGDSASAGAETSNAHNDSETPDACHVAESPDADNGALPCSSGKTGEVMTDDTTCTRQAGEKLEWRDISFMNHDRQQEMALVNADDDSGIRGLGQNGLRRAAELIPRRKPCYGFIGGGDDDDLLYFETEMSQRKEMNKNNSYKKARRCRWDVE
ncbi:hypothetical protein AQUCO_00200160v1 [Aquilegia coerulea]|uniref:WIYLD domain-containing protein n=1 Tax=Aquilegia coerulea TaxID=218851 RepID=A0A2G5F246_AQUCA|nr:hypothetical protein AQUCO_00200160v1 [Aquilegia coerulea]PIA61975.1 hypothetical protein AQUCO_00200160v1 [Aquilegia coerulea]PIA61976.1 hypothetical protein AQUCO_00200160v1 [Aquilegia coerulea]PIA61977.1 hypothetical protein AQUCO_00200160v1 [Aquilegia coerulea]